jgi:dTDP-4-dehydrorhamnose reductase
VEGTARFISGALAQGARVIFFSSDTVYGEREAPFDETAPCAPHGAYAQMKHEVERRFDTHPGVKALRLSYVFCSEDGFTRYLRDCAASARAAEAFHPFYRAVVHREDVVQAVIALAARWESCPAFAVNCGGPQVLSRIQLVQAMKNAVLPTLESRTVDPGDAFFANRPRRIAMRSPRLAALLGRSPRPLDDAIAAEFGASAGAP